MKKLLLFLLLSQVWALTVTKTVSGPELIDTNETIIVSIEMEADSFLLERVEEDIPEHFMVVDMPSACEELDGVLVCEFGQEFQGKVVVSYGLFASDVGYGIFGSPRVHYDGGVKTIDFMRAYFIGKPKAQLTLEGEKTLLPGEEIAVEIQLTNPGAKSLGDVLLALEYTGGSKNETFQLSAGETVDKRFILGHAKKEGFVDILVTASWTNGSAESRFSVAFISPSVSVERVVTPRWQMVEGELKSYVEVVYKMRNNGTAPGNVSFASGPSFGVGPGENKDMKSNHEEKAPADSAVVTDVRGVEYGTFTFDEEIPELKKSFSVLLYEHVGSMMPPILILAMLIGSIYFSTRFENPTIKAGFFLIALISLFLLYSQYSVGALRIPGFGPKI